MKKVILCLPLGSCSGKFFDSWNNFLKEIRETHPEIEINISRHHASVYYYSRNGALGGNVLSGKYQKPWQGDLQYDVLVWINSNIIFSTEQFLKLINSKYSILGGYYKVDDNCVSVVKKWDWSSIKTTAQPNWMEYQKIKESTEPFIVDYCAMDFIACKKGSFESINYPWFQPYYDQTPYYIDFKEEQEYVYTCESFKKANRSIYIDPTIEVTRG